MKTTVVTVLLITTLTLPALAGPVITYKYDARHRLVAASYPADATAGAQGKAEVTYQYDAANNLDVVASITDEAYMRSFLLYLAQRSPTSAAGCLRLRCDRFIPAPLAPAAPGNPARRLLEERTRGVTPPVIGCRYS